jgi:hypothetical protein
VTRQQQSNTVTVVFMGLALALMVGLMLRAIPHLWPWVACLTGWAWLCGWACSELGKPGPITVRCDRCGRESQLAKREQETHTQKSVRGS